MAIPSWSKGNPNFAGEIKQLKKYLYSESNENAKRPLLYPFFRKLNKEKFKIESDACGADVYIEGQIIVKAKSHYSDWFDGFYQPLHYHKKHGLVYSVVVVIAHKFVGIWKVNIWPENLKVSTTKFMKSWIFFGIQGSNDCKWIPGISLIKSSYWKNILNIRSMQFTPSIRWLLGYHFYRFAQRELQ